MFANKRVLISGGTGSLGSQLLHRILGGGLGMPESIHILSRDEDKQYRLKNLLREQYPDHYQRVRFWLGDVRELASLQKVMPSVDIVLCLAALKHVPNCEYFPAEAVKTNILGIHNLVEAIRSTNAKVETVVGISTDKACKPVNAMGMTKALQEKILIQANLDLPDTRFVIARYGNVLDSRGSILPFFRECVQQGRSIPVTHPGMTRFIMTLHQAVDTVLTTLKNAKAGETWVPRIQSGRIEDLAKAMIGDRPLSIEYTGQRPGEKLHEILISEEESIRATLRDDYYVVQSQFPELWKKEDNLPESFEYSSRDHLIDAAAIRAILEDNNLLA